MGVWLYPNSEVSFSGKVGVEKPSGEQRAENVGNVNNLALRDSEKLLASKGDDGLNDPLEAHSLN